MRLSATRWILIPLAVLVASGCAHDLYEQRADTMKAHVKAFYKHLQSDQVSAAIFENEQIEAMAHQIGDSILRRQNQLAASEIDRDWMQVKSAHETAAENWLALAKYLVLKKRYDQARGAYQRILATYTDTRYRTYAEQAKAGLRDLDLILAPTKGS
jgi:hypothetical protein